MPGAIPGAASLHNYSFRKAKGSTSGRVKARPFVLGGIMADILWICNRQRCEDCFEECRHTSDREFAVNPEFDRNRFEEDQDGNLWEDGVGRG